MHMWRTARRGAGWSVEEGGHRWHAAGVPEAALPKAARSRRAKLSPLAEIAPASREGWFVASRGVARAWARNIRRNEDKAVGS